MQFKVKGLGVITDEWPKNFTGIRLFNPTNKENKALYIRSKFVKDIARYDVEFKDGKMLIDYLDNDNVFSDMEPGLSLCRHDLVYKHFNLDTSSLSDLANKSTLLLLILAFFRISMKEFPHVAVLHSDGLGFSSKTEYLHVSDSDLDFEVEDDIELDGSDVIVALSKEYDRCRVLSSEWLLEGRFGVYDHAIYILTDSGTLYAINFDGRFVKAELSIIDPVEFIENARYVRKD